MINVRCAIDIIDNPEDMKIIVESCDDDANRVVLVANGRRYTVSGDDMIVAVENAMANGKYIYGDYARKGYRR